MFSRRLFVVLGMMPLLLSGDRAMCKSAQLTAMPLVFITPVAGGLGVYRPHQPIGWNTRLTGFGRNVHVSYVIRDWKGDVKQKGRELRAVDNNLRIDARLKELGWFELSVAVFDSSNRMQGKRTLAFSIEPEAHSTGKYFRYGISLHTPGQRGTDYKDEVQLTSDSGADIVRADFLWNNIQPTPDAWNYRIYDKYVDDLAARKIAIEGLLLYSTPWAATDEPKTAPSEWTAPKLDAYIAYAKATVNHFRGRVHYWELWNEPDIKFWQSSVEKYTALFNATSKAIKQTAPDVNVLNGGFAMIPRVPNFNFIHDFLSGADTRYWNIWAFHDYNTFPQLLFHIRRHKQYYKFKGASFPVWINEGGFHDLNAGGENEEAITLVKKYAAVPAFGIGAYFWYDLRDDGTDPHDPEDHFGLVKHDFEPKPAFPAYQNVVYQLASRKFEKQLTDLPAGTFAYLYRGEKSADEDVLVIWRQGKNRTTPIWLDTPATSTSVFDMMGNLLPTVPFASGSLVNISDHPLYLHFRGPAIPKITPVLTTPENVVLASGAPTEVSIPITNPSSQRVRETLSLKSSSPEITFSPAKRTLELEPNQSAVFRAKVTAQKLPGSASGVAIIRAAENGSGKAIEALAPYALALTIPQLRDATEGSIPDNQGLLLTANDRNHIVNLYYIDPPEEMHWHGPEDLSATARLAYDASALHLDVDVRDDIQYQTHHGSQLWEGDSLHFMIQTSEAQTDPLNVMAALVGNSVEGWVLSAPAASTLHPGRSGKELPISIRRRREHTIYSIRIPWAALGLSSVPVNGFRFNFAVSDDDGKGLKQFVRYSPGLGSETDPAAFDLFICR